MLDTLVNGNQQLSLETNVAQLEHTSLSLRHVILASLVACKCDTEYCEESSVFISFFTYFIFAIDFLAMGLKRIIN